MPFYDHAWDNPTQYMVVNEAKRYSKNMLSFHVVENLTSDANDWTHNQKFSHHKLIIDERRMNFFRGGVAQDSDGESGN